MPPRRSTPSAAHSSPPQTAASAPPPTPATNTVSSTTSSVPKDLTPRSSPQEIVQHVWSKYMNETPPRILLLDAFMAFLVVVGGVQFVYCVLVGNYPFNAFLSGFSAAVGQFVLTASLRMQMHDSAPSASAPSKSKQVAAKEKEVLGGKEQGGHVSSERAFADYVFGSMILHFFCVNFIN